MITASALTYAYGLRDPVVSEVSLVARPGRVLGLLGPNGSGKTTVLRMLHGSLRPDRGTVHVGEEPLARLSAREVARRLAVVVQEAGGESVLTVREMVLLGRLPRLGTFGRAGVHDHAVADEALARVGAEHLRSRGFGELSGGERQRVLVARALAQESAFLLLDEPTNHLDIRFQHDVLGLVRSVATSAVVVLHDLNLAARYCDDLVLLDGGRVVAAGTPEEVLEPALLESVYGIGVRRTSVDQQVQLLFRPLHDPQGATT
ncbi:ABC transporter ATP-binding protein [Nocardioides panacisoli]|uniref:ABC transporter ATP-binding protein n=1 Tax=Nocardioides panacisoli TaxID=627624 RepID=UPI001C633EE4|nr:ABC transporter ATP-binding protein [Nocardioides panacisoli]QYJ04302.1 ABC transporter ATP-binding protein [Nocardioides panacisoli]